MSSLWKWRWEQAVLELYGKPASKFVLAPTSQRANDAKENLWWIVIVHYCGRETMLAQLPRLSLQLLKSYRCMPSSAIYSGFEPWISRKKKWWGNLQLIPEPILGGNQLCESDFFVWNWESLHVLHMVQNHKSWLRVFYVSCMTVYKEIRAREYCYAV